MVLKGRSSPKSVTGTDPADQGAVKRSSSRRSINSGQVTDEESPNKQQLAPKKGLFRRRRPSMGNRSVERGVAPSKSDNEADLMPAALQASKIRRHHSSELNGMRVDSANLGAGGMEYMEVIVNGKKKMVRVMKKTSSEAAAGDAAGHRKLVKVVKTKKKAPSSNASAGAPDPKEMEVPIKLNIPANHALRKPPKREKSYSDAQSGVWSKAARSLFSFGGSKSKISTEGEDEENIEDYVFQPDEQDKARANQSVDNNKSNHSRGSRGSSWKPPTQLNGEPGVDPRSKRPSAAPGVRPSPNRQEIKAEFFEKYAEEYDPNAPPVLEINTAANNTRTKTKSVYQSESMIRRQFIQDQWLSGGSNYIVWEKAASVSTPATDYTSEEEDYQDDVSEISCEDLTPPVLMEHDEKNELELWERLCDSRIQRLGPRNALTADAYINRGMAQLRGKRLEDAADSLLSAVCFLEEVYDAQHIQMGLVFYLLGKVYMEQEQYPMAESALAKALNIRQLHFGKAHPDTVECWEQLGMSYVRRAVQVSGSDSDTEVFLHRQAMEIMTQVLKLKRAIFGSIHPSVAHTALVVARLCATRNEMERAQRLYKQVYAVLAKVEKEETDKINPDFADPADVAAKQMRKRELAEIEEEMRQFGLKEEILEI